MPSTKGTTNHRHDSSVSKAIFPPHINFCAKKARKKPKSDPNKLIKSFSTANMNQVPTNSTSFGHSLLQRLDSRHPTSQTCPSSSNLVKQQFNTLQRPSPPGAVGLSPHPWMRAERGMLPIRVSSSRELGGTASTRLWLVTSGHEEKPRRRRCLSKHQRRRSSEN